MTQVTKDKPGTTHSVELLDDVRDSAKQGQHAAAEALHAFRKTLDEAVPEAVQPLRARIVDAAIELADKLVAAQYQFNRNLVRSVDRALNDSGETPK
ncbi:hypothetical protein [Mycolicibacterium sp. 050158]|jgi:hypothetical protein|uniref:hypothetical protein n=1 Tax=Mycolicibacterium sp. 050158 TaxID=3090602 RepID=UPI00299E6D2D|nr:hypothetical protein [Mycolicibacterium sp. 050158]MDX1890792.1 hypothetical protein [Mycolicibacterium sp. 050158]